MAAAIIALLSVSTKQVTAQATKRTSRQISYRLVDEKGIAIQDYSPSKTQPKLMSIKGGLQVRVKSSGSFMANDVQNDNADATFNGLWERLAAKKDVQHKAPVTDLKDVEVAAEDVLELDLNLG